MFDDLGIPNLKPHIYISPLNITPTRRFNNSLTTMKKVMFYPRKISQMEKDLGPHHEWYSKLGLTKILPLLSILSYTPHSQKCQVAEWHAHIENTWLVWA